MPKYFWDLHDKTLALLKTKGGCDTFFNVLLKLISKACLVGSELKFIFHWKAQSLIFFQWLFSSFAEAVIPYVTENRDVSSTNNFALEYRSPDKSLCRSKIIMIPKWNLEEHPRWHFATQMFDHLEEIFVFYHSKNQRFKRLPDIPFCDNLKRRPMCHTLSKTFVCYI